MSEGKRTFWAAMAQGIGDLGERMRPSSAKNPDVEVDEFIDEARRCVGQNSRGKASQKAAAGLARKMRDSSPESLGAMLGALSVGLGARREDLRRTVEAIDWSDVDMANIESEFAGALAASRRELCLLWLSMEGSLEFMVWLRAQAMSRADDPALAPLRSDLDGLMRELFSPGLLQMEQVTWRSPAIVLEKVMSNEAGHHMRSWGDLKARLGRDRRVFAVFHSGWPDEPLAFMEVSLGRGVAKSVDEVAIPSPERDPAQTDTATFYAISVPHRGLKGLAFGDFLIRMAARAIRSEMPQVKIFGALSPVPGFAAWARVQSPKRLNMLCGFEASDKRARKKILSGADLIAEVSRQEWPAGPGGEAAREPLERLCFRYLAEVQPSGERLDPVARFHLGNGARLAGLSHLGDPSEAGIEQSFGMMAVYIYDAPSLEIDSLSAPGVGQAHSKA